MPCAEVGMGSRVQTREMQVPNWRLQHGCSVMRRAYTVGAQCASTDFRSVHGRDMPSSCTYVSTYRPTGGLMHLALQVTEVLGQLKLALTW